MAKQRRTAGQGHEQKDGESVPKGQAWAKHAPMLACEIAFSGSLVCQIRLRDVDEILPGHWSPDNSRRQGQEKGKGQPRGAAQRETKCPWGAKPGMADSVTGAPPKPHTIKQRAIPRKMPAAIRPKAGNGKPCPQFRVVAGRLLAGLGRVARQRAGLVTVPAARR